LFHGQQQKGFKMSTSDHFKECLRLAQAGAPDVLVGQAFYAFLQQINKLGKRNESV
jgi:hypothetical protein